MKRFEYVYIFVCKNVFKYLNFIIVVVDVAVFIHISITRLSKNELF